MWVKDITIKIINTPKLLGLVLMLYSVNLFCIFTFQHYFQNSKKSQNSVNSFSSPDSQSALIIAENLSKLDLRKKIFAVADPHYSLLQNILSFIYLNSGISIFFLLLINTGLHTISGLFVYLILFNFFNRPSAFIGSFVFCLNPTSLEWTANCLKDGIFIAGVLMSLFTILYLQKKYLDDKKHNLTYSILIWLAALFLIYKSRPYFLAALLHIMLLICFFFILHFSFNKKNMVDCIKYFFTCIFIIIIPIYFLSKTSSSILKDNSSYNLNNNKNEEINKTPQNALKVANNNIIWKKSDWVPNFFEDKMEFISIRRQGFLNTASFSSVDRDIKLQTAKDFCFYLPKAFLNGLISPYPYFALQKGSSDIHTAGRRVLVIITLLFYYPLLLLGAFYLRKNLNNISILNIFLFCILGIIFFSYLVPNIGALNRMRYGFYMLWVSMGAAYLVEILSQIKRKYRCGT